MRPSVYGAQIVSYNNNIYGVNLGYNFYAEHECGTIDLVNYLNYDKSLIINKITNSNCSRIKAELKYKKALKEEQKVLSRWKSTPFDGFVLSPNTPVYERKVVINNSSVVRKKYNKFLLDETEYNMLIVARQRDIDYLKEKFGKRRIFSEDEILCMPDYNVDVHKNIGYAMSASSGNIPISGNGQLAGAWASNGIILLVKSNGFPSGEKVVSDLHSAIRRGCLAVVSEEQRMFRDRGCCLVVLDKAYGV